MMANPPQTLLRSWAWLTADTPAMLREYEFATNGTDGTAAHQKMAELGHLTSIHGTHLTVNQIRRG